MGGVNSRRRNRIVALWIAALLTAAAPGWASSLTIGVQDPDLANCIPFGCVSTLDVTRYQQVYSATAFPGAIAIDSLTFFRTNTFGTNFANATLTISLSTTSAVVNALSRTLSSNVGADNTFFATVMLTGGVVPAAFTISGVSPFVYNPALGNLLMDMNVTVNGADVDTWVFMDGEDTSTLTSRAFFARGIGFADHDVLVTRIDYHEVDVAVPEPMTLVLIGSALAWYGLRSRRV